MKIYVFENCELDTARREIRRDGTVQRVEPMVFDFLVYLIENRDRVVSKDELNEEIWGGRIVSDSSLSNCLKLARRAVGDSGRKQGIIQTVQRRGFRFVADVESGGQNAVSRIPEASEPNFGVDFDLSHFDRPSVVIMPFKAFGSDDQEILADGIRITLHSMLVKLSGLFLLHSGTVEAYRGQDVTAVDVGRTLDVQYVIEGAVQYWAEQVRVSVQITDVRQGQIIWAEIYDRVLDNVFDLEDEIARAFLIALDIELRSGEKGRVWNNNLNNPITQEIAHRAVSHLYKGTTADNVEARRLYEELVAMKPDWAQGLGMIALTHWRDAQFGWSSDSSISSEKAASFAQRAVELGDSDGIALAVTGHSLLYQRRHDDALQAASEARMRRPSCPLSNAQLAEVLQYCGDPGRGIQQIREALQLVRLFPPWMTTILAACYRDNDEIEASIAVAKDAIRRNPNELDGRIILCCCYQQIEMKAAAENLGQQINQIDPSFTISRFSASQPYKDSRRLDRIADQLRESGLPES